MSTPGTSRNSRRVRESHSVVNVVSSKGGRTNTRRGKQKIKIWSSSADKENKRPGRLRNFVRAIRDETKHLKERSQTVWTPKRYRTSVTKAWKTQKTWWASSCVPSCVTAPEQKSWPFGEQGSEWIFKIYSTVTVREIQIGMPFTSMQMSLTPARKQELWMIHSCFHGY